MRRTRLPTLAAAGMLLCIPAAARAQSTTCNTARGDVFTTYTVRTSTPVLTTPGATDFLNGYSATTTVTVTIVPTNANKTRTWYLCVWSANATWTTTASYAKPRSDMQYSSDGVTWYSVGGTPTQVKTGTGSATVSLMLRSTLAWANDVPNANYSAATYTLPFNLDLAH